MRTPRGMGVGAPIVAILLAALVSPTSIIKAAPPAPAPDVESMIVRVEKPASRLGPDTAGLKRVRIGQSVRIAVYAYFTDLKPGTTARVGLTIYGAGRPDLISRGTVEVTKTGTAPGWRWFWDTVHPCSSPPEPGPPPECLPASSGRYLLSAFIDVAGTQYAKSTSFVVVGR